MERAVFHLAKHLERIGVSTVLFTRPPTEGASFPGDVVTVPYPKGGPRHGSVLDRTLRYPSFSRRMAEVLAPQVREGRIDVVHAQGLTAWGYGRLRAKDSSLAAPLVMNPQGMEEHKAQGLKGLALTRIRRLSKEAARLSDKVIATDEATRTEVETLLGVPPQRVVVLPNGIDPEDVRTPEDPSGVLRQHFPKLHGDPLFLSVTRLEGYKGVGDVLEAFAQLSLASALPAGWAWAIVGHGPERARLERKLKAHPHLASHVHFLGKVPDEALHSLYASSHAFVHATHYEGSSLVTLEAMAHALPVLATRAGGIPDKVEDGVTGILCEPGDQASLARGLEALLEPTRRKAFGEKGQARALSLFAWPSLARRTLALYEELLKVRA